MANEWYRKTAWSAEDERDYFEHYSRARNYSKPQYLRIQAVTLYEQKNKVLFAPAIALLTKYFEDFPDDRLERTGSFHLLARIYNEQKEFKKAFDYYKKAAEFEVEFPNRISWGGLEYAEFIVKHNNKKLFGEAEKYVNIYCKKLIFPVMIYKANAILAIINKANGNNGKAFYYKTIAQDAALAKESGFRYHKDLGLVVERNEVLEKRMRKIK